MADWSSKNITLTTLGSNALGKVQTGNGHLTITRVVASSQVVSESSLKDTTSMNPENMELSVIGRSESDDGGSILLTRLDNTNLETPFTLNELGVYATHSDDPTNEFLYIIAQVDTGTGDKIPLYSNTPVTAEYDLYLYNVKSTDIEVTITPNTFVTMNQLQEVVTLRRSLTHYSKGAILFDTQLSDHPDWRLECASEGTTSNMVLDLSGKVLGDTISDGSVVWVLKRLFTTEGDFFEIDTDGGIMPTDEPLYSVNFELDDNGDIMLKDE